MKVEKVLMNFIKELDDRGMLTIGIEQLDYEMFIWNYMIGEKLKVVNNKTEFALAVQLLSELAALQNGAPLERYREKYEDTMNQVEEFLNKHEQTEL